MTKSVPPLSFNNPTEIMRIDVGCWTSSYSDGRGRLSPRLISLFADKLDDGFWKIKEKFEGREDLPHYNKLAGEEVLARLEKTKKQIDRVAQMPYGNSTFHPGDDDLASGTISLQTIIGDTSDDTYRAPTSPHEPEHRLQTQIPYATPCPED
jgi:hypothetical protein